MAGALLAVSTGYYFLLGGNSSYRRGNWSYRVPKKKPPGPEGTGRAADPSSRFQEHGFADLTGTKPHLGPAK